MILSFLYILSVESRPDAFIVQPLPRDQMSSLTVSPPCGGIPKGKSHMLSQPGSYNPISWQIIVPSAGNCSLKIIFGNDYSQQHTLIPTDNSTDSSGFFPCGSSEGIFSKIFKFPIDVSCDSCTLQWVWENNVGTYYQCSDIEILEDIDAACYGKCQNQGYCSEGLCVCKEGFVGTFCEIDSTADKVNILALFISFMVLVSIASCLLMSLYWRMNMSKPSFTEKRCFEMCCFWLPFNWKNWHQMQEVGK